MSSVVCFSGGVESSVCLYREVLVGNTPLALSFNYGQRNAVELDAANRIAKLLGVQHSVLPLGLDAVVQSGLLANAPGVLGAAAEANQGGVDYSRIDSHWRESYLPFRNIVFASLACMVAAKRGSRTVVMGVTQRGGSQYPDCQSPTYEALNALLRVGLQQSERVDVVTPLMYMSKSEVVQLGLLYPRGREVLEASYTCHNGAPAPGCGQCATCKSRIAAFRAVGIESL